jgi:hypothetical protein
MKRLTAWFAMATLLIAFHSTALQAENAIEPVSMDVINPELMPMISAETSYVLTSGSEAEPAMMNSMEAVETAYANALTDRLEQINEMDMTAMSSSEKNELRKEVRSIQKEQKHGGGFYLSVGAAIIIVLILILLF